MRKQDASRARCQLTTARRAGGDRELAGDASALGRKLRRQVGYRKGDSSGEETGVPFVVLAVVMIVAMLAVVTVAYFLFRRW